MSSSKETCSDEEEYDSTGDVESDQEEELRNEDLEMILKDEEEETIELRTKGKVDK